MAVNVRFNIHKSSSAHVIRMVVRIHGAKIVYYPGIQADPANWNTKAMRFRKGSPVAENANNLLDRIEAETLSMIFDSKGVSIITASLVKSHLDKVFKGKRSEAERMPKSLPAYMRRFAAEQLRAGQFRPNTAKQIVSVASAVERFDRSVSIDEVDMSFHHRFTAHMMKEGKAPSTINKFLKSIKMAMNNALDTGATENAAFRSPKFTYKINDTTAVYLTEQELSNIASIDLGDDAPLRRCRDLFLLGALTGLRYSDIGIKSEDIVEFNGVKMIRTMMTKTNRAVATPLTSEAVTVIERLGLPVKPYANQPMNRMLKELAKAAGIDSVIKVDLERGGRRYTELRPKWEMVTTHTARRTFATLGYIRAVSAGVSFEPLMEVLGHRTHEMFFKYIKLGAEERAALWAKSGGG